MTVNKETDSTSL